MAAIEEANNSGASIGKSCEMVGISERTYRRWKAQKHSSGKSEDGRPGAIRPTPANKLTESEENFILEIINMPEFANDPPSQIVPKLADRGVYVAAERTYYRVMAKHSQNSHRGRVKKRARKHITTHKATAPNQVWMWDITYLPSLMIRGVFFYLYMISDLFSRKIVGWEVWPAQNADYAATLVERAVFAEHLPVRPNLILHSDNGAPMKGFTYLAMLQNLGIMPSYSRPRVSNDNPYAESLFRTVKFCPSYNPDGFQDLEEARRWCAAFVDWYNNVHRHSGINFYTPAQRHSGAFVEAMNLRTKTYEQAKVKHPERWNGRRTRDWSLPESVTLNPERTTDDATPKKTGNPVHEVVHNRQTS